MKRNSFSAPLFFDRDKLLKHIGEKQSMDWEYRDTDIYEHAWQNREGQDLWIEDITKILSPTEQTHLADFKKDRYRVLEQEFYQPEGVLQETFEDLEDAEQYIEANYTIDI